MSNLRLLWESARYYWRTNLAVLLGVTLGTAVIGGALIVGDSVRGSLETMSRERLGEIDYALSSHRFVRESLAETLSERLKGKSLGGEESPVTIAPALVMVGAVERELSSESDGENVPPQFARAGQVNVYGLDDRLWELTNHGDVAAPAGDEIILSGRLAEQLGQTEDGESKPLEKGDNVTLWLELPASIPRDTLLGDREQQTSVNKTFQVAEILPDRSGVGRLELNPSQQLPLNAFVDLESMQRMLELHERRIRDRARNNPLLPARVNALFVGSANPEVSEEPPAVEVSQALTQEMKSALELEDLSLRVVSHPDKGYFSLESEQQILAESFAAAAKKAAEEWNYSTSPVLVYIANEVANADPAEVEYKSENEPGEGYSMYSIVAGLDVPPGAAFPPFEFLAEEPKSLGENDIILSEWLAEDLKVEIGEKVRLKYYRVGGHILGADGKLPEDAELFTVKGIVKLSGSGLDSGLVPDVPGITDVDSFSEIRDERFPVDEESITDRDEEFWEAHKATPKAFVSLDAAQRLWKSRYGRLTSFRVAYPEGADRKEAEEAFTNAFFENLDIPQTGLAFRPVKYQGLKAARGTTDFSGLFVGFSFFLILSATILIGLLFRLGIERRSKQVGLLAAVGFAPSQVRRMFLTEGGIVVVLGGLLGVLAAVGYAELMVYLLKTRWVGAIGTRFLDVYLEPLSLAKGFAISVAITLITIWWALRQLKKLSTRELLSGAIEAQSSAETIQNRGRLAWKISLVCGGVSLVILVAAVLGLVPSSEAFMGLSWAVLAFFVVGIAMLTASLTFLSWLLESDKGFAVKGSGIAGTSRLGMRNAARSRMRSVLTVGLIASATFVIVAVAAGHRNPAVETPDKDSGNGGFSLIAESSTPIVYDLNTQAGREKAGLKIEPDREDAERRKQLLESMTVMPFRVKPGENASCLNLYQTQLPTVLGATGEMIERGGFKFVGADRENPWTLLEEELDPVEFTNSAGEEFTLPAYPVLGDMNTLQYSLHKAVGDVVPVPNETAPEHALQIVGMMDGSIFQGVLVLSETNFNALFPEEAGYSYFLIETPSKTKDELAGILESGLHYYGFDAESVGNRLESFLEVQNTYLSTFQALGGLGLLLGTFGLATVMLRNVLERRSELALLRSVGFLNSRIVVLVLCENAFLLIWGLAAGTVSALIAMAPHLLSIGADVPWKAVGLILGAVAVAGMLAALLAVYEAVRTPVLATLRSE